MPAQSGYEQGGGSSEIRGRKSSGPVPAWPDHSYATSSLPVVGGHRLPSVKRLSIIVTSFSAYQSQNWKQNLCSDPPLIHLCPGEAMRDIRIGASWSGGSEESVVDPVGETDASVPKR